MLRGFRAVGIMVTHSEALSFTNGAEVGLPPSPPGASPACLVCAGKTAARIIAAWVASFFTEPDCLHVALFMGRG